VPLFFNRSGKLGKIKHLSFGDERELQDITESNIQEIFGLEFVRKEFPLGQLRIDTLAFDPAANSFVVIEYKKDRNSSVIDQGYAYLSLLLNNKADFVLEYNELKTKPLKRDEVNWDQSRVIFISPEFTKYQRQAINFRDLPFELWEAKKYDNDMIDFVKLESPESAESITKVSAKSQVVQEVNREIKVYTEETHTDGKPEPIVKKYQDFRDKIVAFGSNVNVKPTKIYIAFATESNFASTEIFPSRLKVWLNIKFGELDDPKKMARDVSNIGHHGSGDYELDILPGGDLEYPMYLIKQSYEKHSA
jgi:predicted transport protein